MTEISFLWGVKRSFLRYLANMPGTQAWIAGGAASTPDSRFVFPAAEDIGRDIRSVSGTVKFQGEVRFTSHGGLLDVVFSDPWVQIDSASARLSFDTRSSEGAGLSRTVVCDLLEQPTDSEHGRRIWEVKLADSGVRVFGGTYAAGELLDPALFVRWPPIRSNTSRPS